MCPYYAARRALPEADIILAPYSCLLVADTRRALGLRLEGNVVIVDEGHNLGGWRVGWSGKDWGHVGHMMMVSIARQGSLLENSFGCRMPL